MARPRKSVNVKDGTYYVYLRKSRKDIEREKQGEMETLARHEADLDEVCERDGYPVTEKFRELVSGESIAERKEFQKLMELVEKRKVTGVIVHAVDRLGRGSIDEYGWVIATLQRTRTLVITPSKVYDPTDTADYMALVMLMIISSGELAAQKERYREGKNRSSKMGEFIGSTAPYGYDKVVVDRHKTLKPNDKADVVRMIFSEVANGTLPGNVANKLNKDGIKTMHGKAWHPKVLKTMIQCVTYKGEIAWGSTRVDIVEKDGFKSVKRQVPQDEDEVIVVPGLHEAIVSEEVWQKANDCLASTPKCKSSTTLVNPLAGILVCGATDKDGNKCGTSVRYRPMRGNKMAKTNRFRHAQYSTCDKWKECNADDVIAMVVDSLLELAGEIELKAEFGADEERQRDEELNALRVELKSVERQAERLIDLYTAEPPAITIEAFRRRNAMLEEQKSKLSARIAEVESKEVPDYRSVSRNVRDVANLLKDPKKSAEHKNAMLKKVVDRIEMVNHAEKRCHDDIELHVFLK